MSVQCSANAQRLRRTTTWTVNTRVTVSIFYRFTTPMGGANRTIWSLGGDGVPQLYFDGAANRVVMAANVSTNLFTPVANTWYWTLVVSPAVTDVTNIFAHHAPVGSAITITDCGTSIGVTNTDFVITNETSNDQTLNGQVVGLKAWEELLTADQAADEYMRITPIRTTNLYAFLPLLNVTNAGTDISGNGNNFTVQGTPTTQRVMPPVTWNGRLLHGFGR